MPSSSWKGYLSFGLISVPIRLYAAARASHVAFHEIHKKCGHRVHQQLYCPYDKEIVSRDEIAMGYEIEKDKYVLVGPDELNNSSRAHQPPWRSCSSSKRLAPRARFELATLRLTAECSTIELPGICRPNSPDCTPSQRFL